MVIIFSQNSSRFIFNHEYRQGGIGEGVGCSSLQSQLFNLRAIIHENAKQSYSTTCSIWRNLVF